MVTLAKYIHNIIHYITNWFFVFCLKSIDYIDKLLAFFSTFFIIQILDVFKLLLANRTGWLRDDLRKWENKNEQKETQIKYAANSTIYLLKKIR